MRPDTAPVVIERAVTIVPVDGSTVEPSAWVARVERLSSFCADHDEQRELRRTVRDMHLTDAAGTTWRFDGTRWQQRVGRRWRSGTVAGPLRLEPFTLDYPLAPDLESDAPG